MRNAITQKTLSQRQSKLLQKQLDETFNNTIFQHLIYKSIIFKIKNAQEPRYTYYSRVIGLSPNKSCVMLNDLDNNDAVPYFRAISDIELLDILEEK